MSEKTQEVNTLEFIQLIKCIIEYYGTTKNSEINRNISDLTELDETTQLFQELQSLNMDELNIIIPSIIDEKIKETFISQLNSFQK